MRYLISTLLLSAVPTIVWAESLTFNAALERAAADAPSLRGRAAGVTAAQSAAISADRLPDPTLDVGIQDFPVTGPDAGRFNRDNFTMQKIGVSQQFLNPAKRHARAARATAEIGIAEADQRVEARSVRLQTALAWVDLYYAEKRLGQLSLLDASLGDLQSTVSARLASGSARPSQALEPDQLRAAVNDRRAELVASVAKARAALARFTGDPNPEIAGTPPDLMVDRARLIAGIATLPSLRAMDAQTVAAEADTQLARADKHPDWKVGVSYGRREPAFGDLVTVGVSIDLPFFSKRRQDPKIAAATSEAERSRFDRMAAEREVLASLEGDLADHLMHHQRLENARQTLVPLAKRRAELDMSSYAAGKLDLGSALLSSLALAEAEIDALAREADVARDAIRITMTYGEDSQ
ncbi:MAG: TolC family protein [Sphingomonas sp.]|nr:TolC family protein [Sphingomonas sp.]